MGLILLLDIVPEDRARRCHRLAWPPRESSSPGISGSIGRNATSSAARALRHPARPGTVPMTSLADGSNER